MKRIFIAAIGLTAVISSCKKSQNDAGFEKPLIPGATVDTLVGNITTNTTLTKTTYLKGMVYVGSGVTLTVNAGVTIKGSQGVVAPAPGVDLSLLKGTLVVERGGKLIANGTASSPIVWTSEAAPGARNYGDWGGIVILGQAPIKYVTTGASSGIYEAFQDFTDATLRAKSTYGGTIANDNSGSITYNRIEFAGGLVAAANREVNGLTVAGVGSGTTIHHVEVAHSGDDGFEFFGGTVSAHHLLSFGSKDDDFDFDEGYTGNLQFIIAYRTDLADNSGSEMIELDNFSAADSVSTPFTQPFIANATFIGPTSTVVRPGSGGRFDGGIYVRESGRIILANSLVIAQAMPTALATTPTTNNALLNPANGRPSYIRNNIFQTASANAVVRDNDETNEIVDGTFTVDNDLINVLANTTNKNTALATYGDFKLGDYLQPLSGSLALTGGINLATSGFPQFVGTTARGAVIPGDIWTSAAWISIAAN